MDVWWQPCLAGVQEGVSVMKSSVRFADGELAAVLAGGPVNPVVRSGTWIHRGKAMTVAMTVVRTSRGVVSAVAAALVVALGTAPTAHATVDGSSAGSSTGMRLVDLETLGGGDRSLAWVMNHRGDIAGISNTTAGSWDMHVVLWRDGRVIDVGGGVGYRGTLPYGVNNRGQVVGCISRRGEGRQEAFVWEDGQLNMLGEGCASGINEKGQVVGTRLTPTGQWRAFLWEQGTMTDLPTPEGGTSGAGAINDRGQIIGYLSSSPAPGSSSSSVMWEHGRVTYLGTLGGASSYAAGINNRGQVVGGSDVIFEPAQSHPFLWERDRMTDLVPDYSVRYGRPYDLNDAGEVVGVIDDRPFLWRDGTLVDLGIPRPGYARAINMHGQIVGTTGVYPNPERPFLWRGGQITYLEILDAQGGHAAAIDSSGRVAGSTATPTGGSHAVVWIPTP